MYTYRQSTGELFHDGLPVTTGYSGHAEGRNNPALQSHPNVGPIPCGRWTIEKPAFESQTHGPVVMRLDPCAGTETFGRSGFLIHGDSILHPGMGSLGCIILPRPARLAISANPDCDLEVIP